MSGTDTDEAQQWHQWHAQREESLREPHGWLSISAYHWITGTSDVIDGVPGTWSAAGDRLTVTATPSDGLLISDDDGDQLVDGGRTIELAESGSQAFAHHGDHLIEVIRRAGRYALRLRDPDAPTRTRFDGVPTYGYDPAWVLDARLQPFGEPATAVVGSAAPGLRQTIQTVGTVAIEIDGQQHTLTATGTPEAWRVSFSDETSGTETAAWRAVGVDATGAGTGRIDFNRAVNYPYVFTDYGTCPRPVAGNHLPVPVRAGEKAPHGRTGVPLASGGATAVPGT